MVECLSLLQHNLVTHYNNTVVNNNIVSHEEEVQGEIRKLSISNVRCIIVLNWDCE